MWERDLLRIRAGMTEDLKPQAATHPRRDNQRAPLLREPLLVRGSADYEDVLDRLSKGIIVTIESKHA